MRDVTSQALGMGASSLVAFLQALSNGGPEQGNHEDHGDEYSQVRCLT